MPSMTRGGGVAAPDPALEAKRAILFLQALQRARSGPLAQVSARTQARLEAGPGGGVQGLSELLGGNGPANIPITKTGGIRGDARQLDDSSVTALMAGLDALRKRLGQSASPHYSQPF